MYQAWIVANNHKLSKAWDDKMFFVVDEANAKCDELNKAYPGNVWKVYEIAVEIKK